MEILDQRGALLLGKPEGCYITIETDCARRHREDAFRRSVEAVAGELKSLLPPDSGTVLVAGLGNGAMTPDAIGVLALRSLVVTRHLVRQLHMKRLRSVAAVSPGVLGTTGMETAEILQGAVRQLRPGVLLVIDALAARKMERVCATVQLSDSGIVPGSGVGNHRQALNRESMGIPVITVGVPTVVDSATLIADALEQLGQAAPPALFQEESCFVTPKDIDAQVRTLARLVGYAVSLALQEQLSYQDLSSFFE